MADVLEYLRRAVEDHASDLFIVAGGSVSEKVGGRLVPLSGEKVFPQETEALISAIYEMAGRDMAEFRRTGDDDFSFAVPGLARFRVNAYRQRGSLAAVVRMVAFEIPDWKTLGIPEEVMSLADVGHGMVLVTGTAGSGKSTTQACVIDRINRTRQAHIITLEDPIEFLHRDRESIVSQREIAIDTADYLSALYDENGILRKPVAADVSAVNTVLPFFVNYGNRYNLLVMRRITGLYNADSFGYTQEFLRFDGKTFIPYFTAIAVI